MTAAALLAVRRASCYSVPFWPWCTCMSLFSKGPRLLESGGPDLGWCLLWAGGNYRRDATHPLSLLLAVSCCCSVSQKW